MISALGGKSPRSLKVLSFVLFLFFRVFFIYRSLESKAKPKVTESTLFRFFLFFLGFFIFIYSALESKAKRRSLTCPRW